MDTVARNITPGVYITELNAFPPSVVGVQTAIPAFIGYTEKAMLNGKTIGNAPVKIASLADYEQIFGAGFHSIYDIEEVPPSDPDSADYDFACQRQTGATSPEWMLKHYRLVRVGTAPQPALASPVPAAAAEDPHAGLAPFNLYNAMRLFYANGGGTCYVMSVGPYVTDNVTATVQYDALKKGLDAIREQSGPTMLVIPDAVLLRPTGTANDFYQLCRDMLHQCADLRDRVAILDVYGAETLDQHQAGWDLRMTALVDAFHAAVGDSFLGYGMAYFPFLVTSVVQPGEINFTSFNIADAAQCDLLQGILNDQADWLYTTDAAMLSTVKGYVAAIASVPPPDVAALNQNLVNTIPLLKQMEDIVALKTSLMPTSAAMAGVYTFVDGSRGVWNAPANVALSAVTTPNVVLNNEQQGALNVPLDGKAINVIRQFVGRGPVVWGARTLDGNSNDWRYIQVRRTIIYIEQSIDAILKPFVFTANDGQTWVTVVSTVSNFLQGLWAQGGLMGDKASDAYTVSCGLGSTMTGTDVLEGYMIVQVMLQMIRPAEFIELTFKQKMQGAA